MGLDARNPVFVCVCVCVCGGGGGGGTTQRQTRPACTSAQFDQRLCFSLFWKVSYVNLLQVKCKFSS